MAKMIPLDPTPKHPLCEGWELIAIQAGRYANGTRVVLHLYNGHVQAVQQLALAQPKTWNTFIDDLATHTQQTAEVIRQAVLILADAVELALRQHDMRATANAPPQMTELMQEAPRLLTRPLMLIDGRAYASTWLWTKTTHTEKTHPTVIQRRRHFVVRDDGVLFGEAGDRPMGDLGLEVTRLDGSHPDALVWSVQGVSDYREGRRREVVQTFRDVVSVFDHFMDFRGSLAPQAVMCELSAALSLMTWLADAFTILPYPWATSPGPGSGKSNWGLCWVMTSYLGYPATMGGTFAALRDLAEMGATLLFDDAELLSSLDGVDPDKRELVLAGNRKGVTMPVKEPMPGGGWRLR